MVDNLTGKDFAVKRSPIAVKKAKDIDYYLLLMTEEDYKEIIKALIQMTKKRIRSRERGKDEKKKGKLIMHQAKFKIISDDLDFEEALIIDEIATKKYKKGLLKKDMFNMIAKGISELEDKEDSSDEESSDKSE